MVAIIDTKSGGAVEVPSCPVAWICCPVSLGGLRQFLLKCPTFPQLKQRRAASISIALGSLAGVATGWGATAGRPGWA